MEPLLALFALPRLNQDSTAQGTKQFFGHLVTADHVGLVESKTHALEIVSCLTLPVVAQSLRAQVFWPVTFCHFIDAC